MSFSCQIYWSARARQRICLGSSIASNWSRYNLCDIVTKASVAFIASTAPDVYSKCCISTDTKIQASIKHETELKLIHCKTWFHSSLLCSFRSTWRTHLSVINRQLQLFFKFGHIAHKFLVVIRLVVAQDSVVLKTVNEHLRLSSSASVPSICRRMYQRNLSGRWLRLICDRHYLLLEYLASLWNWSTLKSVVACNPRRYPELCTYRTVY